MTARVVVAALAPANAVEASNAFWAVGIGFAVAVGAGGRAWVSCAARLRSLARTEAGVHHAVVGAVAVLRSRIQSVLQAHYVLRRGRGRWGG